jgi:hypothetical protein
VGKAAALFKPKEEEAKKEWVESWLHRIKRSNTGAVELSDELRRLKTGRKEAALETIGRVADYLDNQKERTKYLRERKACRPIGSGVTESACKVLIKERMCKAGMRWILEGAANIIAIRSLLKTKGRWD